MSQQPTTARPYRADDGRKLGITARTQLRNALRTPNPD